LEHRLPTESAFLQAIGPSKRRGVNKLPPIFVKYVSAQILLGLVILHHGGYSSGDLKVENTLLMPDFTVRLIDTCGGRGKQGMDIQHLAALLMNASVRDSVIHAPLSCEIR
jgi:serine/threonine protein kinase